MSKGLTKKSNTFHFCHVESRTFGKTSVIQSYTFFDFAQNDDYKDFLVNPNIVEKVINRCFSYFFSNRLIFGFIDGLRL